jgi:hypothetical protein
MTDTVHPQTQFDADAETQADREFCGRFVAGNPGGPGNPFARQTAAFKKAIHAATTPDEAKALARKIYEMAMEGDLAAAKLYFSYTAGKPQDAIDPDRVDVHELEIYRDTAPLKTESATLTEAGLPEPHLHLIRMMRPMMSALMYKQVASIMDPRKNRTPADQGKHPPSPNGSISAKPPSPNPVMLVQGISAGYGRCTGPLANGFWGGVAGRALREHGIDLGRRAMSPLSPTW